MPVTSTLTRHTHARRVQRPKVCRDTPFYLGRDLALISGLCLIMGVLGGALLVLLIL